MNELAELRSLARELGIRTEFTDGLDRKVSVAPETLVRVCAALGAPVMRPSDAGEALRAIRSRSVAADLPPVIVAWDGVLPSFAQYLTPSACSELVLEDGRAVAVDVTGGDLRLAGALPIGYHRLTVERAGTRRTATVIAAPVKAWQRPGSHRSWGFSAHLAALRSARSRSLGDVRDMESTSRWIGEKGGDLLMVLPLLPTFNLQPPEPSPYSPVSRLFWSELMLDLGGDHRPVEWIDALDVVRADAEVREALSAQPYPAEEFLDDELIRYARFRGAQVRLGRNWRDWPAAARGGTLRADQIDLEEERFHLVAQTLARQQLAEVCQRLSDRGMRLGMDVAVGVHPDGYDPWSRQFLFAERMSVGAPPDMGFPSGQDWGFPPVLPAASAGEGHRYVAASIGHQAAISGVLRIDHIMAWTRLYWIPQGHGKHEGTYVSYPADELFAILALESHRNRCEIIGENLGTVPPEITEALPRHNVRGMYLAQLQAQKDPAVTPPTAADTALVNTHDTPTFAGWIGGVDIAERIRCELLPGEDAERVYADRAIAVRRLAERVQASADQPRAFLARVFDWLARSDSPLVVPWLEDLWLETEGVNLPGTRSAQRSNWQRPMRLLLDEIFTDSGIAELTRHLDRGSNAE